MALQAKPPVQHRLGCSKAVRLKGRRHPCPVARRMLAVSGAFHTRLMEPARQALAEVGLGSRGRARGSFCCRGWLPDKRKLQPSALFGRGGGGVAPGQPVPVRGASLSALTTAAVLCAVPGAVQG